MVVVEGAGERIGESMDIVVTNALQTSAGRMIFARPADGTADHDIAHAATSQPRATERPAKRNPGASPRNPRR